MSTYLVVMDPAVPVRSLRYGLLNFASQHKPAELVLLLTPQRLPGETEEQSREDARESIVLARSLLSSMGVPVVGAILGDPLPRKAIAAEMPRRPYDGIILATRAPGLLRFLQFDLASQLERRFRVPVTYVDPDSAGDAEMAMVAGAASRN